MTALIDTNKTGEQPKLLAAPPAKALLPEHASEAEASLSVTMLCSGAGASSAAMHFTEFLSQKLGRDVNFQIRHWTFEELEHLRPGIVARKLAEETHVLVLVTEELRELAVGVRKWMISWLDQARPWYALICLSGTRDLCECLRNACREAGVNFFASRFRTDTAAIHRQVRRAPAAHEAEEGGVTHWGINE